MNLISLLEYLTMQIVVWVQSYLSLLVLFIPLYLAYELPLFILITFGICKWLKLKSTYESTASHYLPNVSCIITCYSEGEAVKQTIISLMEQTYPGKIEIIAVIDGAVQNNHTYEAAKYCKRVFNRPSRNIVLLPKWQRGGRVSTLNAGLSFATGEIIVNVDADTSFDNDMLSHLVRLFENPDVPAVGGALRVRNVDKSMWTKMQAIEYLVSMQGGKTGLAQCNMINNISGAFGAFRRDFLKQIGGWDTHTAEDLDLTVRIKQYFRRYPNMEVPYATASIAHTDAPSTIGDLIKQRLRWDGDLLFLYLRKHWPAFTPKLLGWKSFIFTLLYGYIQNVILPFVILIHSVAVLLLFPWQFALALFIVIYGLYLFTISYFYFLVLVSISERPKQDLKLAFWLPLYPIYAFFMRTVCCFALLNELVRRSHEETSMAPWWVLKRGEKF
ncbi:glycosyltransferase family 2 protein [Pseudoalteromonas sp. NJ631]|uniref:glycosyltransferase family 2 protein n=1 Tax=Pseudoalteromonas sp. NJ631 TaxID=493915 RepID=UPI0002EDD8E7|nr:glycosyltransferase [Pseudoalteromonas sp. NJ631]